MNAITLNTLKNSKFQPNNLQAGKIKIYLTLDVIQIA